MPECRRHSSVVWSRSVTSGDLSYFVEPDFREVSLAARRNEECAGDLKVASSGPGFIGRVKTGRIASSNRAAKNDPNDAKFHHRDIVALSVVVVGVVHGDLIEFGDATEEPVAIIFHDLVVTGALHHRDRNAHAVIFGQHGNGVPLTHIDPAALEANRGPFVKYCLKGRHYLAPDMRLT